MRKYICLLLLLTACESSEQADVGDSIYKGVANIGRGVMALGTLGISEIDMQNGGRRFEANKYRCTQFGFIEGTPNHGACMMELEKAYLSRPVTPPQQPTQPAKQSFDCFTTGNFTHCN